MIMDSINSAGFVLSPPPPGAERARQLAQSTLWGRLSTFHCVEVSGEPRQFDADELWRVCIHETGHIVAARLIDRPIQFATVVPDFELGLGGRVVSGSGTFNRKLSGSADVDCLGDMANTINRHMPRLGESRDYVAPWVNTVHDAIFELLAGIAAEKIMLGETDSAGRLVARSDFSKALIYAETICPNTTAANAFLEFALVNAVETLTPHLEVIKAVADTLLAKREMTGDQIDMVITAALVPHDLDKEAIRRVQWHDILERAAAFPQNQGEPACG